MKEAMTIEAERDTVEVGCYANEKMQEREPNRVPEWKQELDRVQKLAQKQEPDRVPEQDQESDRVPEQKRVHDQESVQKREPVRVP